jgi:ferredoxin
MPMRKIIKIDENKCDGCGLCVTSCAEGALKLVDGKARLVGESYCDGLGACLGECPRGAITIEERKAAPFDEKGAAHQAYAAHQANAEQPHVCPGAASRVLHHQDHAAPGGAPTAATPSELRNWPIQLKLVNPGTPFLQGAELLLVADCVPFACADFHAMFLRRRPVVIGCPKLDDVNLYFTKLAEIVRVAQPRSLTVIRMEVPCCSGLTHLARQVLAATQSGIPFNEVVIGINGAIL